MYEEYKKYFILPFVIKRSDNFKKTDPKILKKLIFIVCSILMNQNIKILYAGEYWENTMNYGYNIKTKKSNQMLSNKIQTNKICKSIVILGHIILKI